MSGGKRDAAYWRHRVERDYPDVAQRLAAGEIPSVRAAAIEAGLLHEPSALDHLRRAWRKASAEERKRFIEEIPRSAWPIEQPALVAREGRRKMVRGGPLGQGELFYGESEAAEAGAGAPPAMNENVMPLMPVERHENGGEAGDRHRVEAATARVAAGAKEGNRRRDIVVLEDSPDREMAGREIADHEMAQAGMPEDVPFGEADRMLQRAAAGAPSSPYRDLPDALDLGRLHVAVGQHYVKLDAGPDPWEVLSIFAGPRDVPHARIVRLAEPDTIRVVSVGTLTDRRRYRPI